MFQPLHLQETHKGSETMARLGDIATYINGYAFKPSDWSDKGLPIIRIQDLTGNTYQANRFNGKYDSKYEIMQGDVLISWSASLGVYVWHGEKSLLNQHIFKVVFDKVPVNKTFFVYQVRKILNDANSEVHGATMKHLTKSVFDSLEFSLPSLEEQQHIATVLDKVSELIDKRKKQLQLLDDLVKARFVEMFGELNFNENGLDVVSIEDLCTLIKDGTHQTPTYTEDQQSGFKFLSSKDVMTQKICWDDIKYIPSELHEKLYATIQPKRNDILMSKNGVNYGVAAVNDTDEVFDIYVSLALLRPIVEKVNPVYLRCAINSPDTKRQFDSSIKGIGVPNLHLGEIKKTKILLPPMSEQNEFVSFVEQVDKSKFVIQKALDEAQLLFDSLMQEYFG